MRIIQLPRRGGKTYQLIQRSAENGAYIVCRNKKDASRIFDQAQEMDLNIPFPLTYSELSHKEYHSQGVREIMIDDLDVYLEYAYGMQVSYCTYTPK